MAEKTTVTITCDMPGRGEPKEGQRVDFALDGTSYRIDVCEQHEEALRTAFGRFIEHAKREGNGGLRRRASGTRPRRSQSERDRSAKIRAWAKEHDLEVGEGGRLRKDVIERYEHRNDGNTHKATRRGALARNTAEAAAPAVPFVSGV